MPFLGTRGGGSVRGYGRFGFTASVTALGGSITDRGAYRYHYFYSNDTLAVSSANVGKTMDVLVVGGGSPGNTGGAEYNGQAGAGGSGSQWGIVSGLSLTATNYAVVVAGSAGTSSFASSYTADRYNTVNLTPNYSGGGGGNVNYNFALTSTQNGVNGSTSDFEGSTTYYAGGGGAGQSYGNFPRSPTAPAGSAGLGTYGGGGRGGNGDGGQFGNPGSPGTQGIVIVRYTYP
jgi:hypothetical protein